MPQQPRAASHQAQPARRHSLRVNGHTLRMSSPPFPVVCLTVYRQVHLCFFLTPLPRGLSLVQIAQRPSVSSVQASSVHSPSKCITSSALLVVNRPVARGPASTMTPVLRRMPVMAAQ